MDLGGVDGANGRFGVGVGGEQDTLGLGVDFEGLLEEIDTGHAGHSLVGEKESDCVLAFLQLVADVERGVTGGGADDAIALAIVGTQVLNDRFENARIVVNGEKNGLRHISCYTSLAAIDKTLHWFDYRDLLGGSKHETLCVFLSVRHLLSVGTTPGE